MKNEDQRTYRQAALDALRDNELNKAVTYALLAQEQAIYESKGIKRPTVHVRAALLLFALLIPAVASAQYTLSFTTNADHNAVEHGSPVVASYEMVLTPTAGGASAALNVGKPTPVNNIATVDVNSFVAKMPAGTYNLVVRAIGPGGTTPSQAVPFAATVRAPSAVTGVGITQAGSSELNRTPSLSKPPSSTAPVKK